MTLQVAQIDGGATELKFNTVRGLFYKIQSTPDLNVPFADEPGAPVLSFDTSLKKTDSAPGAHKFYRAACLLGFITARLGVLWLTRSAKDRRPTSEATDAS